jgi:thymidylate kinase
LAPAPAPQWQARAALARLEQTYRTATAGSLRLRAASLLELGRAAASSPAATRSHLRTVIRLRRGPMIVALSGLDGAGKSSQAQLIERSMRSIGVESAVIWPPARNVLFGMPPALKDRLRRLLATIGRPIETSSTTAYQAADGAPEFPPLPSQRGIVTELLAAVVAISQVLALRRAALAAPGDPVLLIYDRYVLDSIVYLKDRWGHGRALGWQSAAIRMLARRAALSYLLEIEPEEAFARKQDFPIENLRDRAALYRRLHESLGVKALDATRPMEEVGHEICGDIWMMLGLGR